MFETLRTLHGLMSGRPKLARSEGVQVAVCGKHVVQFASDADAAFFVLAYDAVPALLDVVSALEVETGRLGAGALAAVSLQVETLRQENEKAQETIVALERRLVEAFAESGANAMRARAALAARARVAALSNQVATLQAALEAERGG